MHVLFSLVSPVPSESGSAALRGAAAAASALGTSQRKTELGSWSALGELRHDDGTAPDLYHSHASQFESTAESHESISMPAAVRVARVLRQQHGAEREREEPDDSGHGGGEAAAFDRIGTLSEISAQFTEYFKKKEKRKEKGWTFRGGRLVWQHKRFSY